jgi:predicted enzyme related to lactoylglutathione lyase
MANHSVVHLDIPATNTAESASFYADVFGWPVNHNTEYDYWMFRGEGGPGGGFVAADSANAAMGGEYKVGQVLIYINTDDIDASMAEVEAHGGRRLGDTVEMGENGGYAFFADPAGNVIGLYRGPAAAS